MQQFKFTFFFILIGYLCIAQTTLPTSFSFDPNQSNPAGWITYLNVNSGSTIYSNGSDADPACRLDGDGEYVRVNYYNEPDEVTYYLRGTGFGQAAENGTLFLVQESDNGTNWTTLRTFDENNTPGSYTQYSETLSATSEWVRFFYDDKVSGSNIALDQIEITEAPPGPEERIAVFYNSDELINGEEIFLANQPNSTISIDNEGLSDPLIISNATITGPQSSDFSLNNVPASVAAGGSSNFDINFTPSSAGYHNATITLTTSDNTQPTFAIELEALGSSTAPQPQSQPTNINFVNQSTYGFKVTFDPPTNAPEKYLVLRNTSPIINNPVDGITYEQGDYIGNAQIAYLGSQSNFSPSYIRGDNTYYFKVYSFNGYQGYENYLTTVPLQGNHTTNLNQVGNYYNSIDWNDPDLVNDLHNLVSNHTQVFYDDYISTLIDNFEHRDTTNGRQVVTCSYSGFEYIYTEPFIWNVLSREHVFAHSWFPTNPAEGDIEYSDLYNLFPVELNNANIVRSNNPFAEVVTSTQSFMDAMLGDDGAGNTAYEPKASIKGNIARSIFYMCVAYNGKGGQWTPPSSQDLQVLKDWHFQDLPDQYEVTRNDYIESVQNNRNPFVDHPEYVCRIDFSDLSFIQDNSNCPLLTVNTEAKKRLSVYPNPAKNSLKIEAPQVISKIEIFDLSGKKVFQKVQNASDVRLNIRNLDAGSYVIKTIGKQHSWRNTLIVQ